MSARTAIHACVLATGIVLLTLGSPSAVRCFQARDHLTPEEAELIREAQILDKRIDVFIKAVDRRLLVLSGGAPAGDKQLKKDSEKWGELPSGTRAELFGDIARIFDEAITNIDDVSARDEKNPLIPKALRKLAAGASRTVEQLKPTQSRETSGAESGNFDLLVRHAEEIVEAASKLPPPVEKKAKEKGKTEKTKETN